MGSILTLAVVLLLIWIVVSLFFEVAGFLVNLILIIGAILFVVWMFRKLTGSDTGPTDTTP